MPRYKVFAAIDLGSTEITMKIAEVSKKNGISVLDTVKYDLSIGKESYAVGKISYNLVDKICNCFEEYLRIMKSYGVDEYVCYATTAVREASNSEYIIDQINIRTGIKVTIISNEEERFLHNKAFALNNSYFDDIIEAGAVLVDVASGSVQVSHYEQSKLQFSQNLPMGSLRVLENLSTVKNSTISFSSVLEDFIKAGINNYKNVFYKNPNYKYFVIMGNQVRYIKKICGISSDSITEENIDDVYKIISEYGPQYVEDKYEVPYDIAKLMMPSILFYKMFMSKDKNQIIIAPEISLVDGILVEYVEKNAYTHTKVLLKVASIFADTGYYININDYSKYSYDIVKSNPIIGLSQKEHEVISGAVLFQNGIFDFNEYNVYSKNRRLLISKLAAILSLAKSLDVEYNQKIDEIKTSIRNGILTITAYTDSDISLEEREFNIAQEFFEEVFGIKAVLVKKGLK